MQRLFSFLSGYLTISVDSFFVERFINMCTFKGIYLFNIRKRGGNKSTMNISIKGFKQLPSAAYKTKSNVHIIRKHGLPFMIHRYKKRHAFLFGIVAFALLVTLMTSFVWDIEIVGNNKIDKELILNVLKENGLQQGTLKYRINQKELQNNTLLKVPELSWMWVYLKGTKAIVEVKEGIPKPYIVPVDKPCNIISKSEALIDEIITKEGEALVKAGTVVHKGQLLINGVLSSKVIDSRLVHADGEVKGRVWDKREQTYPLYKTNHVPTGNKITRYSVKFFTKILNLFLNTGISYENYDTIHNEYELKFGGELYLGISLISDTYEEYTKEREDLQADTVIKEATNALLNEILSTKDNTASLIDYTTKNEYIDKETIKVTVETQCKEIISQKIPITDEELN